MKKLINEIGKLWRRAARFFENGDLVPFYVIISVAHYIPVLSAHDNSIIAAFVGMAVDMLHFRAVRAWFNGRIWSFHAVIGAMTTVMAVAYHWRFYNGDWLLALPIPVGIAILAYQMSDGDSRVAYIDRLKIEKDTAISQLGKIKQEYTTLKTEYDATITQLDTVTTERNKARRLIDSGMVELGKLPPVLRDYVSLVADGVTPDGQIAAKYGVGSSTVARANSMLLKD